MELNPFIVLSITGALIGWLTNLIAINFLFRPNKKILGIQGVIPKRKKILSEKIAEASLNFLPKKIENLTKIPFIGNQIINYLKKELRFIETSGAVLGFIIGLIQALILSIN